MKSRIEEQGSIAHVVIVIVVVIAVLGLLGFVFWQNFMNNRATSSDDAARTYTAETKYFTIEGYNVRIALTSELSGLKAGAIQASGYSEADKFVPILARELAAEWTCVADEDGGKGLIGSISITDQYKRSGPYEPVATKKVGNYTYGFEEQGANCAGDVEAYNKLVAEFKEQFSQLESY